MQLFDAHLHLIIPGHPLIPNNGYLPQPYTLEDYLADVGALSEHGVDVRGGAVVSGSFQGFDQGYLIKALAQLRERFGASAGTESGFVGVTQLPANVTNAQISELDSAGVRAVRFNLKRGGSAGVDDLESLAQRVYDVAGWHTELYVDGRDLPELEPVLRRLPRISIDHLGMHRDGLDALLRLVERGARVKATGFGRVELNPAEVMAAILKVNPAALMVGTDLPSTRARRPFAASDLDLIAETVVGDPVASTAAGVLIPPALVAVFWDNAACWYLHPER